MDLNKPLAIHDSAASACYNYYIICTLLSKLFSECAVTAFTSFGYNHLFGCKHHKLYTEDVRLCANFIRDARMNPAMNKHLDSDNYCMSTL